MQKGLYKAFVFIYKQFVWLVLLFLNTIVMGGVIYALNYYDYFPMARIGNILVMVYSEVTNTQIIIVLSGMLGLIFSIIELKFTPIKNLIKDFGKQLPETESPVNEQLIEPKLSITFQKSVHPWFQKETNQKGEHFTYRIGVINQGTKTAISVRLINITPRPPQFNAIPCNLIFMHGRLPYETAKDLQTTNDPKAGLFVDVLLYSIRPAGNRLYICHVVSYVNQEIPLGNYILDITASSDDGATTTRKFQFNTNNEPKDMMEVTDVTR